MKRLFAALTIATLLWLPVPGGATEPPASSKASKPGDELSGDELSNATCGDIFDLFDAATPKKDKNRARVEKAQDDAYKFVLWVHGYLSGRDGIDLQKYPLNKDGIVKTVGQIVEVCKPDQKKLFLDAVKDIKIG